MRAFVLLCALAACSPQAPAEAPVEAPATTLAPRVVTTRIHFAQNGQRVDVTVGEPFSVDLPGEQAIGLSWMPIQMPAFISAAPEGAAILPTEAQEQPMPGARGVQSFFFVASAPGEAELSLEQRDFGGSEAAGSDTFRVTIVAR